MKNNLKYYEELIIWEAVGCTQFSVITNDWGRKNGAKNFLQKENNLELWTAKNSRSDVHTICSTPVLELVTTSIHVLLLSEKFSLEFFFLPNYSSSML